MFQKKALSSLSKTRVASLNRVLFLLNCTSLLHFTETKVYFLFFFLWSLFSWALTLALNFFCVFAFLRVCCPRTGNPLECRIPRYVFICIILFILSSCVFFKATFTRKCVEIYFVSLTMVLESSFQNRWLGCIRKELVIFWLVLEPTPKISVNATLIVFLGAIYLLKI